MIAEFLYQEATIFDCILVSAICVLVMEAAKDLANWWRG